MKRLLFILVLILSGCAAFRRTPTLRDVEAAQLAAGPTLTWESIGGAKTYRIWRCPTGSCAVKNYQVGSVQKPFPTSLAQWQIVTETRNSKVRSFPVECAFEYSVQAVGAGSKVAGGGNVVRCGVQGRIE